MSEIETQNSVNDKNLILSNRIGAAVMIGCLIITGALVVLLFLQSASLNEHPETTKGELLKVLTMQGADLQIQKEKSVLLLEHDAQFLRTKRAQSLVSARLFIQSLSILSGISLLIMGSAFVFARIKSPANVIRIQSGGDQGTPTESSSTINGNGIYFASHVPGLVLAFFGTFIIAFTVNASVNTTTTTRDTPVFLPRASGLTTSIIGRNTDSSSSLTPDDIEDAGSVATDILNNHNIVPGEK